VRLEDRDEHLRDLVGTWPLIGHHALGPGSMTST
jgi:hypothetical protein